MNDVMDSVLSLHLPVINDHPHYHPMQAVHQKQLCPEAVYQKDLPAMPKIQVSVQPIPVHTNTGK